jgi:CxxC motif-containing protein
MLSNCLKYRESIAPRSVLFMPPLGQIIAVSLLLLVAPSTFGADDPGGLKPGAMYRVTNQSDFTGWGEVPSSDGKSTQRSEFSGKSKVVYRERIVPGKNNGGPPRLFRLYDLIEYDRNIGGNAEKAGLRANLKRVLLDPVDKGYVIYSPDAKLQYPDLAMLDEHVHLLDLVKFIPSAELKVGDVWDADPIALAELTGVDQIESGSVRCKVEGILKIKDRPFLQISGVGNIVGTNGPIKSRNNLRLGLYVDPENGQFSRMRAVGTQETLAPDNRVVGNINVDYQVLVEPLREDADLNDDAVGKLPAEPTEALLALDFESPFHGVRLQQSRKWILQRVDGSRLYFAGPDISFVVTAEPKGETPTPKDFQTEVMKFIADQKLEVKESIPLEDLKEGDANLAHFQMKGKVRSRPSILDYWVIVRGDRGATVAVNAAESVPKELVDEVAQIVKSITFFEPVKPPAPQSPAPSVPVSKEEKK